VARVRRPTRVAPRTGVDGAGDVAHGTISRDCPTDGPPPPTRGPSSRQLIVRVRQAVMAAGQPDLRPAGGEKVVGPREPAFLPLGSTYEPEFGVQVRRLQGFFPSYLPSSHSPLLRNFGAGMHWSCNGLPSLHGHPSPQEVDVSEEAERDRSPASCSRRFWSGSAGCGWRVPRGEVQAD
jgi:hypothetical protein